MTVHLVPNREIFEEIYPDDSDDSDTESELDWDSDDDDDAVKAQKKAVEVLKDAIQVATEGRNSAAKRLGVLDSYAETLETEHTDPGKLAEAMATYQKERAKIFEDHKRSERERCDAEKRHAKAHAHLVKLQKPGLKKREKEQATKSRQRHEKLKEKRRLKEERLSFWPKKVYRVILHLEASSVDTPMSSRRQSIESLSTLRGGPGPAKEMSPDVPVDPYTISLSLSYVTYAASWSPRYDLSLSTPSKSGSIVYLAEFKNTTSETWTDAKVSLSTSQTSYQGLDDSCPRMHPWHVSLRKYGGGLSKSASKSNAGLFSSAEQSEKLKRGGVQTSKEGNVNRSELFGADSLKKAKDGKGGSPAAAEQMRLMQYQAQQQVQSQQAQPFQQIQPQPQYQSYSSNTRSLGGTVFGSSAAYVTGFGHTPGAPSGPPMTESYGIRGNDDAQVDLDDNDTIDPRTAPLEFEESSWEDNGLTATYDVPGTRTLAPSPLTRRHKIATLSMTNIQLSYIMVPKLRPAAFLRARLSNPSSSVTLLRGSAGLTLDGSFLGNTTVPRCSPGESFTLPLGVDPSVHVSYAEPTVRRSTAGVFGNTHCQIFSRNMWITNTKANAAVELLVLDQVPVSEDERLKIDILAPKGLDKEGDCAKAGEGAGTAATGAGPSKGPKNGAASSNWGKATAELKKNGEVSWRVKIEGGKAVRLWLEYEARLPSSEGIVGI
jgi:hypothetical protein